jgi:hypothetical protein
MYSKPYLCACALILFVNPAWGSNATQVSFSVNPLGSGRWQYDYTVSNLSLSQPIKEFTINFDAAACSDLAVVTPSPTGWNAIVLQPDAFLHDDGAYDALHSGSGILTGNVVSGFSARFDWSGTGTPGSQYFQIVDPVTFATIDSGWTIPEPATLGLLALGCLALTTRRHHARCEGADHA